MDGKLASLKEELAGAKAEGKEKKARIVQVMYIYMYICGWVGGWT